MTGPTQTPTTLSAELAEEERLEAARQYVDQLRAFYAHLGVFIISILAMLSVNLATNLSAGIAGEWSAWWSVWALIGWGTGIAVHGLVVWLNRPSLSSPTWEQRQIDKLLAASQPTDRRAL